jgi:hypothetical protein
MYAAWGAPTKYEGGMMEGIEYQLWAKASSRLLPKSLPAATSLGEEAYCLGQ